MKSKKLFLPTLILIITLVAMVAFCILSNVAKVPTITEHSFPFSITYELNGTTETVDGVYAVSFSHHGGYSNVTSRFYEGTFISQQNVDSSFVIAESDHDTMSLYTRFHPDYLMGDPMYDYFSDEPFEPLLSYYTYDGTIIEEGLSLPEYGAKIISWEYPQPIENSFIFSHIAHLSGEVVIPLALIATLALLVVIIFVRKDKELPKKTMDIVSLVFNILIAVFVIPFATIYGIFSDINGSSPDLMHQAGYLISAITILGLAASICLRRKGFSKSSLIVQFTGPAYFALIILCLLINSLI